MKKENIVSTKSLIIKLAKHFGFKADVEYKINHIISIKIDYPSMLHFIKRFTYVKRLKRFRDILTVNIPSPVLFDIVENEEFPYEHHEAITTEKQIMDIAKFFKLHVIINQNPKTLVVNIRVIYPKWYQFMKKHWYYANFNIFCKYIEKYSPIGILFNID